MHAGTMASNKAVHLHKIRAYIDKLYQAHSNALWPVADCVRAAVSPSEPPCKPAGATFATALEQTVHAV
jgi:hypothetical protein